MYFLTILTVCINDKVKVSVIWNLQMCCAVFVTCFLIGLVSYKLTCQLVKHRGSLWGLGKWVFWKINVIFKKMSSNQWMIAGEDGGSCLQHRGLDVWRLRTMCPAQRDLMWYVTLYTKWLSVIKTGKIPRWATISTPDITVLHHHHLQKFGCLWS